MKGQSPPSLGMLSLAVLVADRASIREARTLIGVCRAAIEQRKLERQAAVNAFAHTLLPGLTGISYDEHDEDIICVVYWFSHVPEDRWYWYNTLLDIDAAPVQFQYPGHQHDPFSWCHICPEFTLETHRKILEFIKKY